MTDQIQTRLDSGQARVVEGPASARAPRHQVEVDQNFGLPTRLFGVTVACYLGFLGLMLASFAAPMLAIPMVIFAGFIVAGFGVPTIWTRLAGNKTKPLSYGQFQNEGVMTHTGRCAPRDAAIQMLILPVLIVFWGIAIAIIAALVG
ncbi:MAG: hypothetical protein QNI87_00880 [Erythrobacter sp.]|uniref:hypothetical protein n=1 Tax=Erythrobacter sp. TaxID=1042 RepID=UPI002621F366|nr:hypothetical protein [Erythrobacter sp.]MDJ0977071.1 hypothetical protein [Erythrobacter sp.]